MRTGETGETSWSKAENQQQTQPTYGVDAAGFEPRGGALPYEGLMKTCGQPGYVFRDFCLKQVSNLSFFVLIRVSIYQFLS